jgi:hypothetical protein
MLKEVTFGAEDYGPDIARLLAPAGGGHRPMPLVKSARGNAGQTGSLHFDRQEPDADNSRYWFGKTGRHPVFPKLAFEAESAGYGRAREADSARYQTAGEWDPAAFIRFCESARTQPGSVEEQLAMRVQLLEWQLLFDHCARGKSS